MTAAFFVDVSNLYHCVSKKYQGGKLDYQKLISKARTNIYPQIERAFAYGAQKTEEAASFITCLKAFGYEPKYRNHRTDTDGKIIRQVNWGVGITIDVVRQTKRVDTIILGSADIDLLPLIEWVRNEGVKCVVFACGIAKEIREKCDRWVEITDDLLEPEVQPEEKEEETEEAPV